MSDPVAVVEVTSLVGSGPLQRDRLIECLHVLQDRFGHLSARHLKALADLMRLSEAEVFEVASFYHHFEIVKEGAEPPPPLTVRVCESLACALAGADALAAALSRELDQRAVRVQRVACVGRCAAAPVAVVGQNPIAPASAADVASAVRHGATTCRMPEAIDFETYRAQGGYSLVMSLRDGSRTTDEVIEAIDASGLPGLGGAGFPAARKWRIVRAQPAPRLVTVNADEGEPGTFKDRHHLERDPHRMFEGALVAAHAVEAERIYVYLRDEYPGIMALLRREVAQIEAAGIATPGFIELRRGAGAYICGEESAMLESIEGRRGLPRQRPPYIAEVGLFGRPTLNHNVETLFWVREIVERGGHWFAAQGVNGAKGLRSWSVSGRVAKPGVIVAPAGITARELIAHAGGMAPGHEFKAYLPGGASGGILPARLGDLPLDFGSLAAQGCFVGSHAVMILSQHDDMALVARNLMHFFAMESCGQCTPCRVGTAKMRGLAAERRWDRALMTELAAVMADASICGLGQAAANPILSVMAHFAEEIGE